MNDNQALILDANQFTSKKDGESGKLINLLLVGKRNTYGHLDFQKHSVPESVFETFTGPGVYDINYDVFFKRDGSIGVKVVSIKKVKGVEF